uniref:Solute carrier family 6 member 18 n=1 Tax=Monodon monoceros TaxID=40151 RepID=A0A8C6AY73_MONMO
MEGTLEPDPPVDAGGDEWPKWDNKLQCLLSCVGFAVGLSNLWRSLYLCQTYGGGAFLIPYLIAQPSRAACFHIELAVGQRLRRGSLRVWMVISPYLGLGGFVTSVLVSMHCDTVLAWVLCACPPDLNHMGFVLECRDSSAVSLFRYRQTLNITADTDDSGSVQCWLLVCLTASWAMVYPCVIRGTETTGKAILFMALFPPLLLSVFLIRGLTLPGATEGRTYLFAPDMQVLQSPRVWLDAATQIFFSLSLAFGGNITFASYNPPRNNCKRDAVTFALVNGMTSLCAPITVFSVLGFKAASDHGNILCLINAFSLPNQSISREDHAAACCLEDFLDKVPQGLWPGCRWLQARLHMPGAPVWAVFFSGMLFSLGLTSTLRNMESVVTPPLDLNATPRWVPKEGWPACFTLRAGNYWLEIFDRYVASLDLNLFPFSEVAGVIYVYGMKRRPHTGPAHSHLARACGAPVTHTCPHICHSMATHAWTHTCHPDRSPAQMTLDVVPLGDPDRPQMPGPPCCSVGTGTAGLSPEGCCPPRDTGVRGSGPW